MTSEKTAIPTKESGQGQYGEDDGIQSKGSNLIESANIAAERIERALSKAEPIIKRHEEIISRERLGGESRGALQQQKPVELTPQEYAKLALSGKIGR